MSSSNNQKIKRSNKEISILGCGWLGLPLADFLLQNGWNVKGSTTSESKIALLQSHGIKPYKIMVEQEITGDDLATFFDSDVIIINFPPRRVAGIQEKYPDQIKAVLPFLISGNQNVLFVSSTSVYPDSNKVVVEGDEGGEHIKPSGKALLNAEHLLDKALGKRLSILRFSGLMGPMRHPGRFFAGKTGLAGKYNPVNFIHLDDCIDVIDSIIDQEKWGEVFNGCAPVHPNKIEFYTKGAEALGMEKPQYTEADASFKIVSPQKLIQELDYNFKFPNPMVALDAI